jgi:hypothetical protein
MVRSCAAPESLQIGDRVSQQSGIVEELGEPAIAVEAQYPPDSTGCVVVVDVLGRAGPTHRANAVLLEDEPLNGYRIEVVATAKVELTSGAVMLLTVLARNPVVARLAVVAVAG